MSKELVKVDVAAYNLAIADDDMSLQEVLEENFDGDFSLFDLPQVKVPSGGGRQWSIVENEEEKDIDSFEGIIIGSQLNRSYYATDFGEGGEVTPPDCSSSDSITGHGSPGGDCKTCELAQFGSAKAGGGQACKQRQSLYILRSGDVLPIILNVPPTSIKAIKKYMISLVSKRKKRTSVITRFTLDKTKNKANIAYSVVKCQAVGDLPKEVAAQYEAHAKSFQGFLKNLIDAQNQVNTTVEQTEPIEEDVMV